MRLPCLMGLLLLHVAAASPASVWYVDDSAPLGGDGSSWDSAYRFLQDALATAEFGDEVHIGAGVYLPDHDSASPDGTLDQEVSFVLIPGVSVLGGFAGYGAPDPNARDPQLYETALCGDLLGDDAPNQLGETFENREDNTKILVLISWHILEEGEAILDGVTIRQTTGRDGIFPERGGGICCEWSNASISDCLFFENSGPNGGGLTVRSGEPLIAGCTFVNNEARSGGAVYVGDAGEPTFRDCDFLGNSASFAGAVDQQNHASVHYEDCRFVGNHVSTNAPDPDGDGGAVRFYLATGSLLNCEFVQNQAAEDGGAVACYDSVLSLVGCVFEGNTAENHGGAMRLDGANPVFIEDCTFRQNSADEAGGAWYLKRSTPVVTACLFESNTGKWGGAVYDDGFAYDTAFFRDCTFRSNTASLFGGAVKLDGASPNFVSCAFSGNEASEGGAVDVDLGATGHGSTSSFVNCTYVNNRALDHGGAVSVGSYSDQPSLVNCLFAGNTAEDNGGAVYSAPSQAKIYCCTMALNQAGGDGQAIYSAASSLDVSNSVIWGELRSGVGRDGDVFHLAGGSVSVDYCCVQGGAPGNGIGNISANPLLRDPVGPDGVLGTADDDWRLSEDSPCLDAGSDARVPNDALDLDADGDVSEPLPLDAWLRPRVVDAPPPAGADVDMGMLETQPGEWPCPGDLDGDDDTDQADLGLLLASYELDEGGDLDGDGDTDQGDLGILLANYECGVG